MLIADRMHESCRPLIILSGNGVFEQATALLDPFRLFIKGKSDI